MKKFIAILLTVLCSLFTIHLCRAQIIHVPADQPSIQAGINAATDGDTVLVADGTYLENISFMGKAIVVASHFLIDADTSHINNTIIDGSQPDDPDLGSVVSFVTGEDTSSVICGFTITGGTGIIDPANNARIGGGVVCYNATAKIIHNKITANTVFKSSNAWGGGIECIRATGSDWIIISHNTISYNQANSGSGIAAGGGLDLYGNARINGNVIINNQCNSSAGDIYGGGICHLSINEPADTLHLENNFIGYNVSVTSGTANGGAIFSQYARYQILANTITFNSLSGNLLFGGGMEIDYGVSVNMTGNHINNNELNGNITRGGGAYFWMPSVSSFENNHFTSNKVNSSGSEWYGAGLMCDQPQDSVSIEYNEFSFNAGAPQTPIGAGAGLCIWEAGNEFINVNANYFERNTAFHGGGFYEKDSYNIILSNNIFSGNISSRGAGIGMYHPNDVKLVTAGKAILFQPVLVNNTFVSNSATLEGGAVRFQGEFNLPGISNCIFWLNAAAPGKDLYNMSSLSIEINNSDLETAYIYGPWTDGGGIIDENPSFVAFDPYFHIYANSPCRNAGSSAQAPARDIDGETRPDPVDMLIDMGSDEFYGSPPAQPVALAVSENDCYSFTAHWLEVENALGYYLDVAKDSDFDTILPAYNNLDAGNDTTQIVEGLDPGLFYYYRVRAYNEWGTSPNSNTIEVAICIVTDELVIKNSKFKIQNYPNPFSDHTTIEIYLPKDQQVSLKLYDLTGREIETLVFGKLEKGNHTCTLNAADLQSGIYLLRFLAGKDAVSKKIVYNSIRP